MFGPLGSENAMEGSYSTSIRDGVSHVGQRSTVPTHGRPPLLTGTADLDPNGLGTHPAPNGGAPAGHCGEDRAGVATVQQPQPNAHTLQHGCTPSAMQHATQQHSSTGMFPAPASRADRDSAWDSRAVTAWREQLQAVWRGVQASHPPAEQCRLDGVMKPPTMLASNTDASTRAHITRALAL